jgi:hypothetical protein
VNTYHTNMCHHWTDDRAAVWEEEMGELTEEDPEDCEPEPEPVTPSADDD